MGHLHPSDLVLQGVFKLLLWWKKKRPQGLPSALTVACEFASLSTLFIAFWEAAPRSGSSWPQLLILRTQGSPGGGGGGPGSSASSLGTSDVQRTSKKHKHSSFHSNHLQPGVEPAAGCRLPAAGCRFLPPPPAPSPGCQHPPLLAAQPGPSLGGSQTSLRYFPHLGAWPYPRSPCATIYLTFLFK